jgi:RNA polymerase nonessential primary-like sigma factor
MSKVLDANYSNEISNAYCALTAEQEREYVIKAQAGDYTARNKLINSQLKQITNIARGYANAKNSVADLIGDGVLGLVEALGRFDLSKDVRFYTFAWWEIRAHITYKVYDTANIVSVPRNKTKAQKEVKDENGKVIKEKVDSLFVPCVSINAPVGDDENSGTFDSVIPDNDKEICVESKIDNARLFKILNQLPELQRTIIEFHIGANGEKLSLEEIGESVGIKTREGVRQHLNKALIKMRSLCKLSDADRSTQGSYQNSFSVAT